MTERAPTLLEQLVERGVSDAAMASLGPEIRKVAEEFAREVMETPGFKEEIRRLVSERLRVLVEDRRSEHERLVARGREVFGAPARRPKPWRIPWWWWQIGSVIGFAIAGLGLIGKHLGWWS